MNPVAIVKAHPVLATTAGVATVGVIGFLMLSGGSEGSDSSVGPMVALPSGGVSGGSNDAIAASVALAQMRSQEKQSSEALASTERINIAQIEAGKYVADLQSTSAYNANLIGKDIELARIGSNESISLSNIAADKDKTLRQIAADQDISAKTIAAQLSLNTATIAAQKAMALDTNKTNTALAQIDAAAKKAHDAASLKLAKINRSKSGLWQIIFGE